MPSTSPVYLATPRSVPLAFDHQEGGGTPQPSPGTRVAPRLCSFLLVVTSERNAERLGFGERPGELQTRSCRVVVAVHAAVHPVGHSPFPFHSDVSADAFELFRSVQVRVSGSSFWLVLLFRCRRALGARSGA